MPAQNEKTGGWASLYEVQERKRLEREAKLNSTTQITAVPQYRSTELDEHYSQEIAIEQPVTSSLSTGVPEYRSTGHNEVALHSPIPEKSYYRKANEVADQIDRTLSPAESKVFEQLLRLSIGFNKDTCRVRVSIIMQRTGYASDKTVRAALRGLELKGRIIRLSTRNSPLGDEYKIMSYSGSTGVPEYRSTSAENTAVLGSKVTGELNTSIKNNQNDDDAALAKLNAALKAAHRELTGKDLSLAEADSWGELADVLIAELKIAAARTTVSSVPSFLAEHLRRRLWKIDKKQARAEGRELPDQSVTSAAPVEQANDCPDCSGSGWWYPNGMERGVAKCKHANMPLGTQ
jgi:hypothetical protein